MRDPAGARGYNRLTPARASPEKQHMKKYEELTICDNFMFAKVFSNADIAQDFLQDILKIDIEKISVVSEATLQEDPFHKSVRLDVQAREGDSGNGRSFDIELQMIDTSELPKRARYYQGMLDLDALGKGVNYDELKEQYILFLCPEDIFKAGKPVYQFQNREETDPNILLGDLCYKNFYIFSKYREVTDEVTREYMQYFATQKYESERIKRIHAFVERYRKDPVAKKAYMTLEQELNICYKKGLAEGLEKGRAETRGEEKVAVARRMLAKGMSIAEIVELTAISEAEVLGLQKEMQ